MPVYQYACTECGEQLEVRQSFTDTSLTECPSCEGRLRKVLNAVGVVFKGSGFYRNDSRAAAKAESGSASAKDSNGSAKNGESSSTSDGSSRPEGSASANGSAKKESTAASASSAGSIKPAPAATR